MQVTQLTPSVSIRGGGLTPVVRELSRALVDGCHLGAGDVEVIAPEDDATAGALEEWRGLPVRTFAPPRRAVVPSWGRQAGEACAGRRGSVFHLHGLWTGGSRLACGHSRHGGATVVSPHGMLDPWALRRSAAKKQIAWWGFERANLRSAACLHALTGHEAATIRDLGIRRPVCVVPNGVRLPRDPDGGGGVGAPPPWPEAIHEGERVLLFLGRIHPKKGLAELVDGWAHAAPTGWHLVIAGWDDGGHARSLHDLARAFGVEGNVHLIGALSGGRKDAALRAASGFILPSFSEGLPVAVLEAWSYRLPVAMTWHCHLPEGFEAGAAVRCDPDPLAIADAIREITSASDAEREEMGRKGRRLVEERFTWERSAAEMAAVYRWTSGQQPAPPACVLP